MSFTSLQNTSVVIQQRTKGGTDYKPVYTWTTYKTLDAVVDVLKESERPRNEGKVPEADTIFYVDYYAGITQTMRIYYNSEYYDIYEIKNPNNYNRHLEIKAKKQKPGETNAS